MTDTPERELIEKLRRRTNPVMAGAGSYEYVVNERPDETCHRAADTIEALLSRVDKLEEALNAIIDRAPERDIKWAGMTARDIAIHTLNRSAS